MKNAHVPIPEPAITPAIDAEAAAFADAIQELGEAVAELRRYIAAGSFDMAKWVAGDIQHTCWRLRFRPEPIDVLCSLARMVYESVRGRSIGNINFAAAIRPILDAMETEVALLEQPS